MRTAERWRETYDARGDILEIIREIQREAFDAGALQMKMASGDKVSGLNRAAIATIDIRDLKGRP